MKKIALLTSALVIGLTGLSHAAEQTYIFDAKHTNIIWHASHFGFASSSGRFGVSEGHIKLDEEHPEKAMVDVTIDVAGLVTGINDFDEHLKSADFLNVEKYPTAHFKSTSVERTGDKTAKLHGDFTLHGVTKPITLEATLNKKALHPFSKKETVGFSAKGVIQRSDFGVSKYSPNVGEDISIAIEAEANIQ